MWDEDPFFDERLVQEVVCVQHHHVASDIDVLN